MVVEAFVCVFLVVVTHCWVEVFFSSFFLLVLVDDLSFPFLFLGIF